MSTIQPPSRNRPDPAAGGSQSLYASRPRIYPKAVAGKVRSVKWAVLIACLALYYLVPWIRWDRGPNLPDQAVLADIANARLFFFWVEIWPQEIYFLTGLLILGAFTLFAVSSLFGRLWCGFACPQTVWTDLFMWVERAIEGDRNERMKLDRAPMSPAKFARRAAKHAAWIAIAAATGGVWVMYFNDAPSTLREMATGQASAKLYFFFGLFTATTYLLAGGAREQVCTYMCPWPRFQAAMLDENSLVVTYRDWRGEPRGKAKAEGVGDCVDCRACVNVCPTGIDIRNGQQLECIGCGLCIDACDDIMKKLDRAPGLIAFETLSNLAASAAATAAMPPSAARCSAGMAARRVPRFVRPRTLMYGGVLGAVALVMLGAFIMRDRLHMNVLRDRAPIFVRLSDGGIRNGYTIKLVNKTHEEAVLRLSVDGPVPLLSLVQDPAVEGQADTVALKPDAVTQWRVFVTAAPRTRLEDSTPVTFRLTDAEGRVVVNERSVFLAPANHGAGR